MYAGSEEGFLPPPPEVFEGGDWRAEGGRVEGKEA